MIDEVQPLLEVKELSKWFHSRAGWGQIPTQNRAVDRVNFLVRPGETLGLVGESGCGKSTLARCVVRLLEPDGGEVRLEGTDITHLSQGALRPMRRKIQMVFQDPLGSLNPRKRIGQTIADPLRLHRVANRARANTVALDLLETVGLSRAYADRFPSELSGGQRQRVGIARALALKPKLVILDEPVSSLDVSIQAQIINLLQDLQESFQLSYLFISHNLGIVRHICNRVAVMYLGAIVETADVNELFSHPRHPYTAGLLSAVPIPDPVANRRRRRLILEGDVPGTAGLVSGCRFNPRCPYATDLCRQTEPALIELSAGHAVACHHPLQPVESEQIAVI